MHIQTAKTADILRQSLAQWRMQGESIAFVPTMGALHEGHMSLISLAKRICDHVVVSIFVNPTQFGAGEDFDRYPRTTNDDIALLAKYDADIVYLPEVEEIYPQGFQTVISVPGLSQGLCGAARPGHFDGVCTVVARLLFLTLPDILILGEKDFQQLKVVERMVQDIGIPIDVVSAPTTREADGLAMSSRNRYLSVQEREAAPTLYRTLGAVAHKINQGGITVHAALEWGKEQLSAAGFHKIDYFELRDSKTLQPLEKLATPARLLVAAHIGSTRLIDNVEV